MRVRLIWAAIAAVVCAAVVVGCGRLTPQDDGSRLASHAKPGSSSTATTAEPSTSSNLIGGGDAVASGPTKHYISNTGPDVGAVARLGYDLFDLGPDKSRIDALGPGQQALVWLGNLDNTNCRPGYTWSEFQNEVRNLAQDPKVFGYFISDEPHPGLCPNAVRDIRQRADFIRAENPQQKSFIVVMDASRICGSAMGCEYRELNEAITHVDLIGIDPFPCGIATGCSTAKIDLEVQRAIDAGISVQNIVPVFQVFGQGCSPNKTKYYLQPSATQLNVMLAEWHELVPNPAFDFTYTWRSEGPACPSLDRAAGGSTSLQSVMKKHNGG
jgi:hypothetical protein